LTRQLERLESRAQTLLELAEERVIGKEEFAARKLQLEAERAAGRTKLAAMDAEIAARAGRGIDIHASVRSIGQLSDVYAELDEPAERRRLLETCVDRLIVGDGVVEVRVPVQPAFVIARRRLN
jgi:hypothetical protein